MSKNEKMIKKSWTCIYCDGINPWDNYYCKSCGSRWVENTEKGKEIEKEPIVKDNKKEDILIEEFKEIKEKVETEYYPIDQRIIEERMDKYKTNIKHPIRDFFADIFDNITSFFIDFCGDICLWIMMIVCIIGFINMIIPDTKTIEVTGTEWKSSIEIEYYETLIESDWTLPEDANLLYTQEEIYEYNEVFSHNETTTKPYSEQVFIGYDENNIPVYQTITKEETYEEAVYTKEPVYKTKYYYELQKDTEKSEYIEMRGNNKIPIYSEITLKENQKEGDRCIVYYIKAIVDGEEVVYYCEKDIFDTLEIGQTYEVIISEYTEEHNFGHILKDLYKIEKIGKYTLIEILDEIFI